MSLIIRPLLLLIVLLLILTACSTTGPGPEYVPVARPDLPAHGEFGDQDWWTDPSDRSLTEIEQLSKGMIGYQPDVALEVLRSLESIPSDQLVVMIDSQLYDPEFTEWLELSLQVRTLLINDSPVKAEARKWADYHYGHAITQGNFPDLVSRYRAMFPVPSRVAILLPTSGSLAAVANAIRDGIISAYLERPDDASIRFYSSGESSEAALAAYLQAREDGATQIVGPLHIDSTRALSGMEDLSVPVLLLNEPDDCGLENPIQAGVVNSLSLSQAREAEAIARRALAQGQTRAIMMVPDSAWGTRVQAAFSAAFEQGAGQIAAATRFNPDNSDHSAVLTHMLKIDDSRQRKANLQSQIGIPLTFEPSRRDDFDFVFMAARPAEGRELKPLLRFHDAGDIPVYAMGRIYSGRVNRASDQDLNDIIFAATRWQLATADENTPALESLRGGSLGNFYALGQDAWHLLPYLPLMQKDPDLWFPGAVGDLKLQVGGHLFREPVWAQFLAGQPVPYQWQDPR